MADTILAHYPNFAYLMVKKGTAAYYLLKRDFGEKYQTMGEIPESELSYLAYLKNINQSTFDTAEALGWRQIEQLASVTATTLPKRDHRKRFLNKFIATLLVVSLANQASALFVTADTWNPNIEGVGTNRYAYPGNDPVNLSDPNGHVMGNAAAPHNMFGSSAWWEARRLSQQQQALDNYSDASDRNDWGEWEQAFGPRRWDINLHQSTPCNSACSDVRLREAIGAMVGYFVAPAILGGLSRIGGSPAARVRIIPAPQPPHPEQLVSGGITLTQL